MANFIIQRKSKHGYYFTEPLTSSLGIDMMFIPGDTFTMGSPEDESERRSNEGPQHTVTIKPFFMGKYPVTQVQWLFVAGLPAVKLDVLDPNPSSFKGVQLPVEQVSWDEAVEFCARLSQHTGRTYQLPSEAQWEYACRAGTTTPFHFGETITPELANYRGTETFGDGPNGVYRKETTYVGSFPVNAFGLCDTHGNVLEWCQDVWHSSYEGASSDGSAWTEGSVQEARILRGGSWYNLPGLCRSAFRNYSNPDVRGYSIGFRVVCLAPEL